MSYHHGDLPSALREAAVALVAEEGFAGLSMRKIARRAGVSHAAPAHHYADLEALLADVVRESFAALGAQAAAAQRGLTDPLERLRAYGLAYVAFATQNPGRFRIMFHPLGAELSTPAREVAGAALDSLIAIAGELRAPLPAPHLALLAWSVVHGFATLWIEGPLHEPEVAALLATQAEAMVATLLDTFGALLASTRG